MELSKLVTDRQKSDRLVLTSVGTTKSRLMQNLAVWPGFPPEVTAAILDVLANKVEITSGAMVAADNANLAEADDDVPFRKQRDESAEKVRACIDSMRETVTVAYGEGAKLELGLESRSPADPAALNRLANIVNERLGKWTPPASSRLEGYTLNKETWSGKLGEPLQSLGSALSSLAEEKREAEVSLVEKNRAIEERDRAFTFAASLLSTLLEAAGDHELARRVRPSRRKPGETTAEEEASPGTPESPSAVG